ncbi:UNVERIFIED_CONTAM: hypothetical protein K2H54_065561 [Gekko kuhli]
MFLFGMCNNYEIFYILNSYCNLSLTHIWQINFNHFGGGGVGEQILHLNCFLMAVAKISLNKAFQLKQKCAAFATPNIKYAQSILFLDSTLDSKIYFCDSQRVYSLNKHIGKIRVEQFSHWLLLRELSTWLIPCNT